MENNVYSAPNSDVAIAESGEHELAGRWSRLGASIIDGLTIMPITLPLMYFTGGFAGLSKGVAPSFMYSLGMALVGILVFIIIHGYLLVKNGQTVGKKVLGIKIVTLENELPKMSNLTRRYGLYWLLPQIPMVGPYINLVNVLFIFTKSKRCLHDHLGGTKVVLAR